MPGFITHYLYGVKTYHVLENFYLKSMIKEHLSSYLLGLQGPDMYFFYIPSFIDKNHPNIGSLMHSSHVQEVFSNYLDLLEDLPNQKKYTIQDTHIAVSYFAGFICHYILDCVCHPYIYGRTHYEPNQLEELHYYASHRALETQLDSLMLHHIKKMPPCSFSRASHLKKYHHPASILTNLLSSCINLSFSEANISPKELRSVFRSAKLECSILDDKWGIKKPIIEKIESKTVEFNLISSLMSDKTIPENEDILNLSHQYWYSPWEPDTKRNDSFFDLFQKSLHVSHQYLSLFQNYIIELFQDVSPTFSKRTKAREALLKHLGNNSYHTGLDCTR